MTHIRLAAPGDLHDLIEKDPLPLTELTAILDRGRILIAVGRAGHEAMVGWLRWGLFWDCRASDFVAGRWSQS